MEKTVLKEQEQKERKLITNVIDCDVHPVVSGGLKPLFPYMSKSWQRKFEMEGPYVETHRPRHPNPRGSVIRKDAAPAEGKVAGSDPSFVITDYLDKYEIKSAILMALQPAKQSLIWTNPETVRTVTSAYNDYFIEHWLDLDDRFHLAISVTPHDPQLAVDEIKRLSNVPGVVAVYLPLTNTSLGNRFFYPIYEAALEEDLPIMSHVTGGETTYLGAPTVAGGIPVSYLERYVLYPQIAQTNVANLIFEGVFERYPDLNVVFVEYGFSWLGPLMTRMDQAWQQLRIETPWVKKKPSEYVRDNIFLTTQPVDELPTKELNQMLQMLDAENNLLYSSDYPHWDNDMPNRTFDKAPVQIRSRNRILHDNAMSIFKTRLRV